MISVEDQNLISKIKKLASKYHNVKLAFDEIQAEAARGQGPKYNEAYAKWMRICSQEDFEQVCTAPHGLQAIKDEILNLVLEHLNLTESQ